MKIPMLLIGLIFMSLILINESLANQLILWQATGDVEIRKEPSTTSELIFRARGGTLLRQVDASGQWIKVQDANSKTTGWVHRSSKIVPITQNAPNLCVGDESVAPSCPIASGTGQTSEVVTPINRQSNIPPITPPQGTTVKKVDSKQLLTDRQTVDRISLENIVGETYIVAPEQLTAVKMSSSDINRIVCPVDIKDVVYSEEKGVNVKLSGKNAFVKFIIKRIDGKENYSTTPTDMFVVCNNKVYSLVAIPDRIPPVTVYLEDKERKIKEIIDRTREMPYEKRIVNYVREVMSGKAPIEATNIEMSKQYKIFEHLDIVENSQHIIEGEGVVIRTFTVTAKKNLDIREKDFLKKEITTSPLAISLNKLKLSQGEKAMLVIIERARR